jgi:hypothetical protein
VVEVDMANDQQFELPLPRRERFQAGAKRVHIAPDTPVDQNTVGCISVTIFDPQ